jgi:hypothetical protein
MNKPIYLTLLILETIESELWLECDFSDGDSAGNHYDEHIDMLKFRSKTAQGNGITSRDFSN